MWSRSQRTQLQWRLLRHKSINWESWAPLSSHSQTEEPFYDLFMLVKAAAIFQPPFGSVLCTPSHRTDQETLDPAAWEHRNQPDFAHVHGCTHAHAVKHKYSHHHSSAPRPPALSSPAAITLSRHKKAVPKTNTISTCTLAWGNVRGNTSLVFFSFRLHSQGDSGFHHVPRTWLWGPHSKPNSITASLYMPHVFLDFWRCDCTMCVLFSCTLCAAENAFISGGQGFAGALPSRGRGSAPDTSHTQSGLRESSGGRRRSTRASSSQPCPRFPFIYFTFPLLFYPPFSQSSRVATRWKEHLLTIHAELSPCVRLHRLISRFALI